MAFEKNREKLNESKSCMNFKKSTIVISELVLFVALTGCGRIFQKPTLSLDAITIGEIRHRVEQNYLRFSTAKVRAKISLESPQMSFMANSNINIKKPDSLMINLSAGLGLGIGSIFLDKNQFLLYSSLDNTIYTGNPDSVNLRQFLLVDIKFEDIVQAFSGLHLIKTHEQESLQLNHKQYLLIGKMGDFVLKYWVDPKKFVVTEYELINQSGKTIIKFEYDQFVKTNRVILPKTIRISQPDQRTRMTIVVTSLVVNEELSQNDFLFKIPDNAVKVSL